MDFLLTSYLIFTYQVRHFYVKIRGPARESARAPPYTRACAPPPYTRVHIHTHILPLHPAALSTLSLIAW